MKCVTVRNIFIICIYFQDTCKERILKYTAVCRSCFQFNLKLVFHFNKHPVIKLHEKGGNQALLCFKGLTRSHYGPGVPPYVRPARLLLKMSFCPMTTIYMDETLS